MKLEAAEEGEEGKAKEAEPMEAEGNDKVNS